MTGKLPIPNVSINKLTVTVFSAIVLTTLMSCRECPTEPQNEGKDFALDYAGPSFVSLSFSISGSGKRDYAIQRDSLIVLSGTLFGEDTIVTDWNAEPSTVYRYRLLVKDHEETIDKSDWLSVTTMDTTSHEFTWMVDVLGENGTFWDVWAFSEDNVWVTGKYERTWDDSESFSLARWDGQNWTNHDIAWTWLPAQCIYAFSSEDIWCWVGYPAHNDGTDWYIYTESNSDFPFGNIYYDCWGTSSDDMYFVGSGGSIVHYNGQSFTKMTSPTDRDLLHIDGYVDSQTGNVHIWAGGWPLAMTGRGSLIELKDNRWITIFDESHTFYSSEEYVDVGALFVPNDKYIVLAVGGYSDEIAVIHNQQYFKDYKVIYTNSAGGGTRSVYGNSVNDFFEVGDEHIIHYNGKSIKTFNDVASNYRLRNIKMFNNYVFIVGEEFGTQKAIVIRGER